MARERWEGEVRGKEGAEASERVGKGKGGLDLDTCPGPRLRSYATGD